ncbi:MAG: IS1380 family transposase [Mariprofundaceae bacterium]|nr:IS1380 family transposase [Mariprofundaceae bacterium]
MTKTTSEQLRFPTVAGMSIRADFDGGAMSSDFGALLLAGVDRQMGLSARLAASFTDRRHASYVEHELSDLLKQRIYQQASAYEDCNDANDLRGDPMFKLAVGRKPLGEEGDLASQPTFSRLENAATRKDIYHMSLALVDQFMAGYAREPKVMVLDMDHTDDPTHGQQEFSFYNHHYRTRCYLPLTIFDGLSGQLITAVLRPGKRPTGKENAMIMKRVLKRIRQHWPNTNIILRGDGHFSNPELMQLCLEDGNMDFIFGLPSNKVIDRLAEPLMQKASALHAYRQYHAKGEAISNTRLFGEFDYAAGSWPQSFRVIHKAEVMDLGDNPRFIVTSLVLPSPEIAYTELYCSRGNAELYIKELKRDLSCDRTSDSSFLANCMRLITSCTAYQLIHSLRSETLRGTRLAHAQASTIIAKLFKIAVRVVQYKDRIKLHLPSSCPVKDILAQVTEILYGIPPPKYV